MNLDYRLSIEETTLYLGVTKATLANWRSTNCGPKYYKPTNKLIYYFKSDLDEWIKKCKK